MEEPFEPTTRGKATRRDDMGYAASAACAIRQASMPELFASVLTAILWTSSRQAPGSDGKCRRYSLSAECPCDLGLGKILDGVGSEVKDEKRCCSTFGRPGIDCCALRPGATTTARREICAMANTQKESASCVESWTAEAEGDLGRRRYVAGTRYQKYGRSSSRFGIERTVADTVLSTSGIKSHSFDSPNAVRCPNSTSNIFNLLFLTAGSQAPCR
jgi:hypothetical protein